MYESLDHDGELLKRTCIGALMCAALRCPKTYSLRTTRRKLALTSRFRWLLLSETRGGGGQGGGDDDQR
jgi:hypothetical protein